MSFDATLYDEMTELAGGLVSELAADGLVFGGRHVVECVTTTSTGGDPDRGIPGTITETKALLTCLSVELNPQRQWQGQELFEQSDAKIRMAQSEITKAQLEAADYFLINGEQFTLDDKELMDERAGIFWTIMLKRRAQ